ncbi:hypothetical protein NQ318_015664 [Aromia moschata]|uniref:Uncharacterized protein n=1 Tax=Aromia moschata TaxID=1265417 RepID=A0AAV8XRM7_9CUCU|nr:hypothetical protein NQ318_015664 [Aromia moschata]
MFSEARKELRVSLRKLTKRVGDLREENKKLKQELKVSKAQSKRLSDKVDHLKDVIKELVDTNLISGDALSVLDKTKKTRTKETELVRYLGIKSVRLQEAL